MNNLSKLEDTEKMVWNEELLFTLEEVSIYKTWMSSTESHGVNVILPLYSNLVVLKLH